ncbi:helix-turn-helix transcriptional regulator [Paenibacillus harenae]|uniref:helix-turn-helix transcriptional regulator n=1 Tax=Paenibacillus harenae TaxID=306543 RepID=UPI001FDF3C70|nr:AraC family transcriptional regulator [Paenibacillus harenae]
MKPYMDIPYTLEGNHELPDCRFRSIWKVQANDAYQVVKPDGFSFPGLFMTCGGKGLFTQSEKQAQLVSCTFLIAEETAPCSYGCHGGHWDFYFIEFSGLGMARQLNLPIGHAVTTAKMPEAVQLCERLIDGLILQPAGYGYAAHLILQELLLLFARDQAAIPSARFPELDEALYRMHKHIGVPFRVEDFIRGTGLSRTVFFERFRAMTGMPPSRYMLELKLASAKASLETTNVSVKEIAASLSFYDEFHFSKAFKQRYGVSPRAFRDKR